MSTSQLAGALPPNEAPSGATLAQVEPFNSRAREGFLIHLLSRKDLSRERTDLPAKHKYIRWLTELVPERGLDATEAKLRSWVKANFLYERNKLWKLPGKRFTYKREVISEEAIFETIVNVYNSSGHCGQEATAKKVNDEYYGIAC